MKSNTMRWSNRKPTEPGYYFWRYSRKAGMGVVRICLVAGRLYVDGDSCGNAMLDEWVGQWAGPIDEPTQ